jgi:hypothetical protein
MMLALTFVTVVRATGSGRSTVLPKAWFLTKRPKHHW